MLCLICFPKHEDRLGLHQNLLGGFLQVVLDCMLSSWQSTPHRLSKLAPGTTYSWEFIKEAAVKFLA